MTIQKEAMNFKRGPRKILADYKLDEIYNFYKELHGEKALPRSTMREVYKRLFPAIVELMVFDNFELRLPARLGHIRVKKKLVEPKLDENGNIDARRLSVDFKKTKKLWQKLYPGKTAKELKAIKDKPLVRELNEDFNGYRVTWFWDKTICNIPNQSAYYIKMTRDNCRILSNGVKYNNLNFYE